jgi:hypothetical protein
MLLHICDHVYGKTRQKWPGKIQRKRGKVKKLFSKDASVIHFIRPNVQKYIQNFLKIAPNVIKISSIPI